ncbi:MAG: hypothetical protein H7288_03845 [Kineosporiaceae bacterium]|nr:hypothetical protein [Aeromicrobium sp.]
MTNAIRHEAVELEVTDDVRESVEYFLAAAHRTYALAGLQDNSYAMLVSIIRESADQLSERQTRGGGLTEDQAAFLIESGTFTAESLAETEASVARGDLAELERKTRLEAITASLGAAEVAAKLGIDTSRVRHRQAKDGLYAFMAGGRRRYPTWQFTPAKSQPVLPGIAAVIRSFPEDMHPASIQNIMTTPQRDLLVDNRRVSPVEWLLLGRSPQNVVDIFESILQS